MNSYENGLHSEIIDIATDDTECNELAKFPHPVESAAGGLVSGKPIICGGFYENVNEGSDKCFILGEDQPIMMADKRSYPSSISISRNEVSQCRILGEICFTYLSAWIT